MNFTPIDWTSWPRGQYFNVHYNVVPNTYSITANIDISTLLEAVKDNGLNPIEVLAEMDITDIHRCHPHLFMAGGIDVSQLLPFGSRAAVKDVVKRAIDAAEGRIMIGSSTELNNDVPLENFLALREAVLENVY